MKRNESYSPDEKASQVTATLSEWEQPKVFPKPLFEHVDSIRSDEVHLRSFNHMVPTLRPYLQFKDCIVDDITSRLALV